MREGAARLQGLATCGHCGRRLHTHYTGRSAAPGYHCSGKDLVEGRGVYCLNIGGTQIDEAVTTAFLAALTPAAVDAALAAAQQLDADDATALTWWGGIEAGHYRPPPDPKLTRTQNRARDVLVAFGDSPDEAYRRLAMAKRVADTP